eukprot:jgi/Chlat1/6127/Chrsp409S05660
MDLLDAIRRSIGRRQGLRAARRFLDPEYAETPAGSEEADAEAAAGGLTSESLSEFLKEHATLALPNAEFLKFQPRDVLHNVEERETGKRAPFGKVMRADLAKRYPPNRMVRQWELPSQNFCGRFTEDGNVFLSACQDQNIRLYTLPGLRSGKPFKRIFAKDVGWSIIDTDFSPDQRMLIYSSWSNFVHICNVYGEHELHEGLDMKPENRHFCMFSIKFAPDGREIVAGASDNCLYIYDIETKRRTLRVHAHRDDINSVCFADSNPNIVYSGSDDCLIKVWDRRLLRSGTSPQGVLIGHCEGITHVTSKGDGRYILSNSKDQSARLWDARKLSSESDSAALPALARRMWDYRWEHPTARVGRRCHSNHLPMDASLVTYAGHSVLQTLVRAHFSPAATTEQRYVYTGSSCGAVHVYDVVSGKLVRKLGGHGATVRDASWHPYLPIMVTSSWDCTLGVWEHVR